MSSTEDLPPMIVHYGKTGKPLTTAPDPNHGRADDYPNQWKVEFQKQTAKCNICSRHMAGTKWCVACANCGKRMCIACWTGERYNTYDEKIFEGEAQNKEGCWCRFSSTVDPKWWPAFEARTARMQKMIAEERKMQSLPPLDHPQGPAAKKPRLDQDDDREQSPSDFMLHPRDAARLAESASKKRAASQANPLDEDRPSTMQRVQDEQSRKDSGLPKIDHLEGRTTVIVGAGVIGLAIARELACHAANSGTEHEIVVVEARDSYAELASHDCAGLITRHGVPKKLGPVLDVSLDAWHQILSDPEIGEKVHFQPQRAVHVKGASDTQSDLTIMPPSWVNTGPEDVFSFYESDVGRISTRHYADWLYEECDELGVHFRFHQEVSAIEKTKQAQLQAVDVSSAKGDSRWTNIHCHNLILAAGPWTPMALKMLAIWLPDVDNFQQRYEWTRIGCAGFQDRDDVGLILRSRAFGEGALISTQTETNEILVATVRGEQNNSHVTPTEARVKHGIGDQSNSKARKLAKKQIVGFDEAEDATDVVDGRSLISTSFNQRPIIGKIPAKLLDERHEGEDDNPMGIYLAFGFGRFGTTLAPGAATILRRMICRDEDVTEGMEAFAFPAKHR